MSRFWGFGGLGSREQVAGKAEDAARVPGSKPLTAGLGFRV